jgi:hypothetical protein
VLAPARIALGDAEPAEARERDLTTAAEDLLDGVDDGIDGVCGLLARQTGALLDGIDELGLRHECCSLCCRRNFERLEATTVTGPFPIGEDAGVTFNRIAWLVTVGAAFITALLLFLSGYNGYGAVAIAVGLSAAINLR